MATYLFSRKDGARLEGVPRELLGGQMFFDLWRTRMQPFATVADGDTMLLFDTETRRVIWEFRARAILRGRFESPEEVSGLIRSHYGLLESELNLAILRPRPEGWILGWAAEVIRPLDLEFPAGFRMTDFGGRHGYVELGRVGPDLKPALPPCDPALVPVGIPQSFTGGGSAPPVSSRYVPTVVKRLVWERDGGRCVRCRRGPEEIEIHFDHIHPFSKGGTSTVENLELLCRDANLSKGASVTGGGEFIERDSRLIRLARSLGLPSHADLSLVAAAADPDDTEFALGVAEEADAAEDLEDLAPLVEVCAGASGRAAMATAFVAIAGALIDLGGHLEVILLMLEAVEATGRPFDLAEAALARSRISEDSEERLSLLTLAYEGGDEAVRCRAAISLALMGEDVEQSLPQDRSDLLHTALLSDDPQVEAAAALMLAASVQHGDERDQFLRRALRGDVRTRAYAALQLALSLAADLPDESMELLRLASEHPDVTVMPEFQVLSVIFGPNADVDGGLDALASSGGPAATLAGRLRAGAQVH